MYRKAVPVQRKISANGQSLRTGRTTKCNVRANMYLERDCSGHLPGHCQRTKIHLYTTALFPTDRRAHNSPANGGLVESRCAYHVTGTVRFGHTLPRDLFLHHPHAQSRSQNIFLRTGIPARKNRRHRRLLFNHRFHKLGFQEFRTQL